MQKGSELIGVFPIDHNIRVLLPNGAEDTDAGALVKARLQEWFRGVVTYHATATWQEDGQESEETLTVMETHATDAQLTEHREDMQTLVATTEEQLGFALLDVNNRLYGAPSSRPLTTEEAAAYLGVTVATVKYHVYSSGKLRPVKAGHDLAFTHEELDRYKASRRARGGRK